MPILSEPIITELLGSIEADRLMLLCGAGLSIPSPSNLLPAWRVAEICFQKRRDIEVLPDALRYDLDALAGHFHDAGHFKDQFLGIVPWAELLGEPNAGHAAVSDLLISRAAHSTLSANFDPLIEIWAKMRKIDLRGALDGVQAAQFSAVTSLPPLLRVLVGDIAAPSGPNNRPRKGAGVWALACPARLRGLTRIRVSEEFAIERVWTLATMFNRIQFVTNGAPRRKDIVESLDKFEMAAAAFADALESLDDITRHLLQTGGSGIGLFRDLFPNELMKKANVDELPRPSGDGQKEIQCQWISQTRALSQYAGSVRTTFLISKGIKDPDRVDQGGNTNLIKELFGSARYQLVQEGWHVYDLFKPGEQSGTEGGPFHLFLCAIFEFATGQCPEENSKLMPLVKKACNVNRQLKALRLRENELLHELNILSPKQANQPRLIEIEVEALELRDRISTLLGEIWPSGGRQSPQGKIPDTASAA